MTAVDIRSDGMMSVLNRVANERARFAGQGGHDYVPAIVYATDGIAAAIVDKPAEDAIASGFVIEGDENKDILNEFDRLDAWPVITNAIKWARLHGGGAILMFVQDGLELTEPLDLNRIRLLEDLIDYPASRITPGPGRYADPTKKNYGWPSNYYMQSKAGGSFLVHESRLIFLSGDPLPDDVSGIHGMPWVGRSALDLCYKALSQYNTALKLAEAILLRKQQLIHRMSDLGNMLAQGMDDIVSKRLAMADSVRGVFNMLAVDAADDVILADSDLNGIADIVGKNEILLCASSRTNRAVLFGDQVSGLNASAEGLQAIYHGLVTAIQNGMVRPAVEQLAGVIWAQQGMRREPVAWQLKFNPLWSPSEKEVADVAVARANARKIHMEAVNIAIENQRLTEEESRAATAMAFPELDLPIDILPNALPDDDQSATRVAENPGGDDGIQGGSGV